MKFPPKNQIEYFQDSESYIGIPDHIDYSISYCGDDIFKLLRHPKGPIYISVDNEEHKKYYMQYISGFEIQFSVARVKKAPIQNNIDKFANRIDKLIIKIDDIVENDKG